MKENGFTLIELLATIAIMGLLTAMITPSIINLQNSNKKKKFEIYGKTMVEAAKIYVQKEGDDLTSLGVSNWVGCIDITYSQLLATELIKPFDDTDYDCVDLNSKVRVTRNTNGDTYTYNLVCKSKNSKKDNYSVVNIGNNECSVKIAD